jgi:hypothetical protein
MKFTEKAEKLLLKYRTGKISYGCDGKDKDIFSYPYDIPGMSSRHAIFVRCHFSKKIIES